MDKDLAFKWADEGVLPTFKRLLRNASWRLVDNPPGLVSGGTWQTFASGVSPSRHGLYNAYEYFDPNSYGVGVDESRDPRFPPFWELLSQAGQRVAVLDVPYAFLAEELNGIQILDWFTHTRLGGKSLQALPPSLATELEARFGSDPLGTGRGAPCERDPPRSRREIQEFRQKMIARIQAKTIVCEELLSRQNWDLFLPVFCECHCVGHNCWHVHDEGYYRYDPAVAAAIGNPVRDVYVAMDKAIARLIERAGSDATVMVYCSFGMTRAHSGTRLLDEILLRLDGKPPRKAPHKVVDGLRQVWRSLPNRLRGFLRPIRSGVWERIYRRAILPDHAKRRFFEVKANDATGGVRINLIGREAKGLVEPGEEYDRICEQVTANLLTFVNVDTGRPLVREVVRTDRVYRGERLDRLPDLLVHWNREGPILRVTSPTTGLIENRHLSVRSGDHAETGLVLTSGPGVIPGQRKDSVAAADLVALIAAQMGVALASADIGDCR
jgi:predicted AlkP superfamily phosphohydrolase/phosphomutase